MRCLRQSAWRPYAGWCYKFCHHQLKWEKCYVGHVDTAVQDENSPIARRIQPERPSSIRLPSRPPHRHLRPAAHRSRHGDRPPAIRAFGPSVRLRLPFGHRRGPRLALHAQRNAGCRLADRGRRPRPQVMAAVLKMPSLRVVAIELRDATAVGKISPSCGCWVPRVWWAIPAAEPPGRSSSPRRGRSRSMGCLTADTDRATGRNRSRRLSGSMAALVTPFKNGQIDETAFIALCQRQIDRGTAALVPCGTTGEASTLTHDEQLRVIALAVEAANRRVPIIAGAGSNCTSTAIGLVNQAEQLGADAVLSVVPYYNRPPQEGLYQHFATIQANTNLPVLLYDVPARTGTALALDTILRLAELPNIAGIKAATAICSGQETFAASSSRLPSVVRRRRPRLRLPGRGERRLHSGDCQRRPRHLRGVAPRLGGQRPCPLPASARWTGDLGSGPLRRDQSYPGEMGAQPPGTDPGRPTPAIDVAGRQASTAGNGSAECHQRQRSEIGEAHRAPAGQDSRVGHNPIRRDPSLRSG